MTDEHHTPTLDKQAFLRYYPVLFKATNELRLKEEEKDMTAGIVMLGIGVIGIVGLFALYRRAVRASEELPSAAAIPWLTDSATDSAANAAAVLDFLSGLPLADVNDSAQVDLAIETVTGKKETVSVRVNPNTARLYCEEGVATFAETLRNWKGRTDMYCVRCLGPMFEDVSAGFLYDLVFADAIGEDFDAKIAVMQDGWKSEREALEEQLPVATDYEIISDDEMEALFAEMSDGQVVATKTIGGTSEA